MRHSKKCLTKTEELKNNQTKMNNIRNEMKTEGIFSRITEAKEWISDLEAEWKSLPWNRIKRKELKEMKTA